MQTEDRELGVMATDVAVEEAGKQFGRFALGFMGILENASRALAPVVESMLIKMAEAWATRIAEKNS